MLTKRVKRFLSVAAMAPLVLTACDSSLFDPDNETGTYQMTFYNGTDVPATFTCQPNGCLMPDGSVVTNGTLRVNSGTLVLRNNGTFTETNRFTVTPSGQASESFTLTWDGDYEYDGFNLSLYVPPQGNQQERIVNAELEFDTISYIENGQFFQYDR